MKSKDKIMVAYDEIVARSKTPEYKDMQDYCRGMANGLALAYQLLGNIKSINEAKEYLDGYVVRIESVDESL